MTPAAPEEQTSRIFASFDGSGKSPALPALCALLLAQQQATWKMLRDGLAGLDSLQWREIRGNGLTVKLQYNPNRIVSTGANLDPAFIEKRPCFLCPENLPAPQKAVLYRGEFFVLCNPSPIFNPHYTIAHLKHLPQVIAGALTTFLQLAADLGEQLTVLYNGALCGASAPDHLHFQAVPAGVMPMEAVLNAGEEQGADKGPAATLRGTGKPGWPVLVAEGEDREEMEFLLRKAMAAMQSVLPASDGEPMMNLCGSYRDRRWRVLVFPRRRHRPEMYYGGEEERILVSPGAVDMGGVIVAPRERDFRRLDEGLIRTIFADVSPDEETFNRIMAGI